MNRFVLWFLRLFAWVQALEHQVARQKENIGLLEGYLGEAKDRIGGLESSIRELGSSNASLREDLLFWRSKSEKLDEELKTELRRQAAPKEAVHSAPTEPVYSTRVPVHLLKDRQNRRAMQQIRAALEAQIESESAGLPEPEVMYDANS